MKNFLVLCLLALCFLLTCAMFSGRSFYYVVFENDPAISDTSVYFQDNKIGQIIDQTKNEDKQHILSIGIDKKHNGIMKTNSIFFIKNGALVHGAYKNTGMALSEKAYILGLPSKNSMDWLKRSTQVNDRINYYYVVFEKASELIKEGIYSQGIKIGKVHEKDLGLDNSLIYTISIDKDYFQLMNSGTIFYIEDGTLKYDIYEKSTQRINEKAHVLGFPSKNQLIWFKTKNKFNKFSDISKETITGLLKNFE
ncbi:MAG: hypothetical protein PF503_19790 [Desulfobacula sp.]|jgi:hypothetical protein|nr:hypothetical protein [Desulfobacula sp.]